MYSDSCVLWTRVVMGECVCVCIAYVNDIYYYYYEYYYGYLICICCVWAYCSCTSYDHMGIYKGPYDEYIKNCTHLFFFIQQHQQALLKNKPSRINLDIRKHAEAKKYTSTQNEPLLCCHHRLQLCQFCRIIL